MLNAAALIAMLAMVFEALWFYFTTDKIVVPMHWNAVGDINSYGKTWTILVLAAIGVVVYLLLLCQQKAGHLDLPFAVRDAERARQLVKMLFTWLTFLISLILLYVVGAVAQLYLFRAWVILSGLLAIVVAGFCYTRRIFRECR